MNIGEQIIAPEGMGALAKGKVYHFLYSDPVRQRVLILEFRGGKREEEVDGKVIEHYEKPEVDLIVLPRDVFERGLINGEVLKTEKQSMLPPWLSELEGYDFEMIDENRHKAKITHKDRVERRLSFIEILSMRWPELRGSEDLIKEINDHARNCKPKQNETRLRLWLFTYLAFGRNVWSLFGTFHHIGMWSRIDNPPKKKIGRPASEGKNHGNNICDLQEKIFESIRTKITTGKKLADIYSDVMKKDFGCRTRKDSRGKYTFYHPDGKRFPNEKQFRYYCSKYFDVRHIKKSMYGETIVRNRYTADRGKFSETFSNLMEQVESDAYALPELPKGLIMNDRMPPVVVVRGVCMTSGYLVGIGFSLGGEKEEAYRSMQFCMAIPKKKFGELFGIDICEEDWPSQGLPLDHELDRGPGAGIDLPVEAKICIPGRELAPAGQGQSKATIESTNPRSVKKDDAPEYIKSNLSPTEIAIREIRRLIEDNKRRNIIDRMTPEMIQENIMPTPLEMYRYMDARGRNDAVSMSFDDAVRSFLTRVIFKVKRNAVYLEEAPYDSEELRKTGVLDIAKRTKNFELQGYALAFATRTTWIEINGKLIEVYAKLAIRDNVGQLFRTLPELKHEHEQKNKLKIDMQEHQPAVRAEARRNFNKDTGKEWDDGKRVTSKKPSRASLNRSADAKAFKALASRTKK